MSSVRHRFIKRQRVRLDTEATECKSFRAAKRYNLGLYDQPKQPQDNLSYLWSYNLRLYVVYGILPTGLYGILSNA